jgi:hypothetical protein
MTVLPALTAILLLRASFQANFTDLVPVWTDEVYYWHQALSFKEAGFNSGYYTVNEIPAPAEFSRFFAWGPMIPAFYGTIGKFTGWYHETMPLVNLVLVTLAMGFVLWQARSNRRVMQFMGIAVATFSPMLLNGIASGVVSLELSIALIAAAGFARILRDQEATPRSWWLACLLFLLWAATIRLTWGVFVLPLLMLVQPKTLARQFGAFIAGGMLLLMCAAWYQGTAAPFPYAFGDMLATLRTDANEALRLWAELINLNLARFNEGDWLERHMRYVTVGALVVIIAAGLLTLLRRRKGAAAQLPELAFHAFNLGSVLIFNVFVYDMAEWRDYRQFAPRILLSLVVFSLCRRWSFAIALALVMALSLPAMKTVYDIWTGYHLDPVRTAEFPVWHEKFEPVLVYDADAPSPWCNTVVHSALYGWSQVPMLMAVDGGMGLSSPIEEQPKLPFLSRYIMLENAYYETIADQMPNLKPLLELLDGWLYENPDVDCD